MASHIFEMTDVCDQAVQFCRVTQGQHNERHRSMAPCRHRLLAILHAGTGCWAFVSGVSNVNIIDSTALAQPEAFVKKNVSQLMSLNQ